MYRINERESEILAVLGSQADWITRSQLAKLLGKNRLNQLDLEALAALEGKRAIEVDRRPDPRPVGFVLYYRKCQEG